MNPRIEKTHLADAVLISSDTFLDDRGSFSEAFRSDELCSHLLSSEKVNDIKAIQGLNSVFPQDNIARSKPNVIRGLHIQTSNPQGKLVRCIKGKIFDVILDLRRRSSSFGKFGCFELNDMTNKALWVPPGFAHGYYSYDESIVYYKCSTLYNKESDGGVNPFCTKLNIKWPSRDAIISDKDLRLPDYETWLRKNNG